MRSLKHSIKNTTRAAGGAGSWMTPDVFLAIRENRVDAYYRGCRLMRLRPNLVGEIHYKYLMRPSMSNEYVKVEDGKPLDDARTRFLTTVSEVGSLDSLKRRRHPMPALRKRAFTTSSRRTATFSTWRSRLERTSPTPALRASTSPPCGLRVTTSSRWSSLKLSISTPAERHFARRARNQKSSNRLKTTHASCMRTIVLSSRVTDVFAAIYCA